MPDVRGCTAGRRRVSAAPQFRASRSTIVYGVLTLIWPPSDVEPLTLVADTHALLFTITGAQLVTDTGIGAMKSLIVDVDTVFDLGREGRRGAALQVRLPKAHAPTSLEDAGRLQSRMQPRALTRQAQTRPIGTEEALVKVWSGPNGRMGSFSYSLIGRKATNYSVVPLLRACAVCTSARA